MWPFDENNNPNSAFQTQTQNQRQLYQNPTSSLPSAFLPPTAHVLLSVPTRDHPGFSKYSTADPFGPAPPKLPPTTTPPPLTNIPSQNTAPKSWRAPLEPQPSAFYNPNLYHDYTRAHPRPSTAEALRPATPRPHVTHAPRFGSPGFGAPAPHELGYAPFASPLPQAWGIQNRPFGYQATPAFPGAVFHGGSEFRPDTAKRTREMLPSERVRQELCGEAMEMEGVDGARGEKRKRKMTPSQKVRKRLAGLGPREAWDADSP